MYKILTLIVISVSFAIPQPGFSQRAVDAKAVLDDCPSCDLPSNMIAIVNGGNKTLSFYVKPKGGKSWSNFRLKSRKSMEIACSGCSYSMDAYHFQMKTGKRKVSYSLPIRKRYILQWNANRRLWDLTRP